MAEGSGTPEEPEAGGEVPQRPREIPAGRVEEEQRGQTGPFETKEQR